METNLGHIFTVIFLAASFVDANVLGNRLSVYEQIKYKGELAKQGLYVNSQHVISLTFESLKPTVFDKKYATLVEVRKKLCTRGHQKRLL